VDGSATMPSAVFADENGTLMVGRDAERRARLDPTRFEPNPKRRVDEQTLLLGDDVIPVNEALAAVLRRVLEETARQLGGEQPDEVRLTHPAQWGPVRRNVLLSAARLAGASGSLSLVPEPLAAAAHFASFPGKSLPPGQALAVYDLGAGTFDVAVVGATQTGFTVLAEDGLPDLGGLDVDQALLVHVGREVSHRDPQRWQRLLRPESTADRRTRRALQEDVRAAKEAMSRHPQTEVPMPEPFTDVLVTRAELEALVRPAMLRSVELLSRTLHTAGLGPDRLGGIYLVGGSSRLPLVATMWCWWCWSPRGRPTCSPGPPRCRPTRRRSVSNRARSTRPDSPAVSGSWRARSPTPTSARRGWVAVRPPRRTRRAWGCR
jgi:molecular chaperone DnaK (HSP70)